MVVNDVSTGDELEAVVEPVTVNDFKIIRRDRERFDKFNWNKYREKEVYKLRLKNNDTILGLMCLTDHTDPDTNAIEIDLLEVSAENIGTGKKLDGIGGCLIAFACRESFKRGHDGVVFLIPKTGLVSHYSDHYGFLHVPLQTPLRPVGFMILTDATSRKLMKKYLE